MRYAVVIEKAGANYSRYVPDLPGCVATGDSVESVERELQAAIRFHIDGLTEDGIPVPCQPRSQKFLLPLRVSGNAMRFREAARTAG